MKKEPDDEGTIEAVLARLTKQRLPLALGIKKRVDAGERLNELDLEFLRTLVSDAMSELPMAEKHPEFNKLVAELTNLYDEITRKALANEQGGAKG